MKVSKNLNERVENTLAQYNGRSNIFKISYERIIGYPGSVLLVPIHAVRFLSMKQAKSHAYIDELLTCLENGNRSTSASFKTGP